MKLRFSWDENKNYSNLIKHGIDFNDITEVFSKKMLVKLDKRKDYSEERLVGIGFLRNTIVVVVWTKRKDEIRIISARKANKKERKIYNETSI